MQRHIVIWGGAYEAKGLYEKAIDEFKETIRINPADAKAHYNLGANLGDGLDMGDLENKNKASP